MPFPCCNISWLMRARPGVQPPLLPWAGASQSRRSVSLEGRHAEGWASGLQCWLGSRLCADCIRGREEPTDSEPVWMDSRQEPGRSRHSGRAISTASGCPRSPGQGCHCRGGGCVECLWRSPRPLLTPLLLTMSNPSCSSLLQVSPAGSCPALTPAVSGVSSGLSLQPWSLGDHQLIRLPAALGGLWGRDGAPLFTKALDAQGLALSGYPINICG